MNEKALQDLQEIQDFLNRFDSKLDASKLLAVSLDVDQSVRLRALDQINLSYPSALKDFANLCKNGGLTKEQLYLQGCRIYRDLDQVFCAYDSYCDVIFSDRRALITFYLVFGNLTEYGRIGAEKNLSITKDFGKTYAMINPEDFTDITTKYFIQQGNIASNCKVREVIFVGDHDLCVKICDRFYGAGNYHQRTVNNELKFRPATDKAEVLTEAQKQENIKNMQNAISEIEKALIK